MRAWLFSLVGMSAPSCFHSWFDDRTGTQLVNQLTQRFSLEHLVEDITSWCRCTWKLAVKCVCVCLWCRWIGMKWRENCPSWKLTARRRGTTCEQSSSTTWLPASRASLSLSFDSVTGQLGKICPVCTCCVANFGWNKDWMDVLIACMYNILIGRKNETCWWWCKLVVAVTLRIVVITIMQQTFYMSRWHHNGTSAQERPSCASKCCELINNKWLKEWDETKLNKLHKCTQTHTHASLMAVTHLNPGYAASS